MPRRRETSERNGITFDSRQASFGALPAVRPRGAVRPGPTQRDPTPRSHT